MKDEEGKIKTAEKYEDAEKKERKRTREDSVKSFRKAFQPMSYSGGQRSFMKYNQQNNNGETA